MLTRVSAQFISISRRNLSTLSYQSLRNQFKKAEYGKIVDTVNKEGLFKQSKEIQKLYEDSVNIIGLEAKSQKEICQLVDSIRSKYKLSVQDAFSILQGQAMKNTLTPKYPE